MKLLQWKDYNFGSSSRRTAQTTQPVVIQKIFEVPGFD